MADDFIVEDESPNRTFLYAVGGMGAILVIGLIAIAAIVLGRQGSENNEIVRMNQTIAAQNAFVTQTVAAMEALAVVTPTSSRTAAELAAATTRIPTFTPSPRASTADGTVVVQTKAPPATKPAAAEGDTSAAGPEATATPAAPPAAGELPSSGLGMWGAIVAGAALIVVIVLARRLRPAV